VTLDFFLLNLEFFREYLNSIRSTCSTNKKQGKVKNRFLLVREQGEDAGE
jgi:hypothetical protein